MRRIFAIPIEILLMIFVAGIVVGFYPFLGLIKYSTSSSAQCMKCHESGYLSIPSQSNIHSDSADCISCHGTKNSLIPLDFPKAFSAEKNIVSKNCMKCHRNSPAFIKKKENGILLKIPHKKHIEFSDGQCILCHRRIAHKWSEKQTHRPEMEDCFSCHSRNEDCTTCHPEG